MSTPISRRISESDSFVSSSESLVESSSDETPALDKQSKSLSPPVMKTKKKRVIYARPTKQMQAQVQTQTQTQTQAQAQAQLIPKKIMISAKPLKKKLILHGN